MFFPKYTQYIAPPGANTTASSHFIHFFQSVVLCKIEIIMFCSSWSLKLVFLQIQMWRLLVSKCLDHTLRLMLKCRYGTCDTVLCNNVCHKYSIYCELLSHFILKSHGYAVIWNGNTLQETGEVGNLLGYSQENRVVKVEVEMLHLKIGNKTACRC